MIGAGAENAYSMKYHVVPTRNGLAVGEVGLPVTRPVVLPFASAYTTAGGSNWARGMPTEGKPVCSPTATAIKQMM